MANAIKFAKDAVFTSKAAALAHINEIAANSVACGAYDSLATLWDTNIIRDNLPTMEEADESGETQVYATFGPDEAGQAAIVPETAVGNLAVVTIWSDVAGSELPQAEGAPYARPVAIYLISLPTIAETLEEEKLSGLLNDMLQKASLAAARKLAKAHAKDPETAPIPVDRLSALLAASQSRSGKSANAAFKALFPVIQKSILAVVGNKVEALRAAKDFNNARIVHATFSKARLNAGTLEECLSSAEAAAFHFPSMPQTQWENILKFAIAWAPKHKGAKIVKDDAGNTIKDADGKAVREEFAAPQSPVLFQSWLETRNQVSTAPEAPSVDLSELMAG